jgi:hypothetical protein
MFTRRAARARTPLKNSGFSYIGARARDIFAIAAMFTAARRRLAAVAGCAAGCGLVAAVASTL